MVSELESKELTLG